MSVDPWKEMVCIPGQRFHGRGIDKVPFQLPSGEVNDFYLFVEDKGVACLALTKNNEVILAKQYRPGPREVLIEMPGGGLKDGEKPEEAIQRELREETGYEGKVGFITTCWHNAYSNHVKYAFVVTDCEKVTEPKLEDNGETVEPILMSLPEFRLHLRRGQLTDIEIGYLGLDYLGLL